MEKRDKNLRRHAKALGPILAIGKNGLTDGSIALIDRELQQKQLIKIKFLASALPDDATKADRKKLAGEIATRTRARVVEQVGHMLVLFRE